MTVNYLIAKGGQTLYLLSCTQHWKPTRKERALGVFIAGTVGSGKASDTLAKNSVGTWTECPAFVIGVRYALSLGNTSDARLEGASGGKPFKLDYLSSAALPISSAQSSSPSTQPQALSNGAAKLHITSSPSGGEIYVDGKFFGNTPSDITLATGEHAVKITVGGKEWTRNVQVTAGEIHLHAELPGMTSGEIVSSRKQYSVTVEATAATTRTTAPADDVQLGWIGATAKRAAGGGAIISSVISDGPAAKGGLKVGDIITQLNGVNVGEDDFEAQISQYKPGSTVRVGYMRNAWAFETTLTVSRMPMLPEGQR